VTKQIATFRSFAKAPNKTGLQGQNLEVTQHDQHSRIFFDLFRMHKDNRFDPASLYIFTVSLES
jgi:hypothetical protein